MSDYYTAAVVEYSPIFIKDDIKLTYEKNTDEYINYIERASKQVRYIVNYNFYDVNVNSINNVSPFLRVYILKVTNNFQLYLCISIITYIIIKY